MTYYPPPSPPYLGPPDKHSGDANKPIGRIVLHSTVSPCEAGGARRIAAYFRSEDARGSAHYVVDPAETVQAAYDSLVCWHAPPNPHSLGIEMCEYPRPYPGRWSGPKHRAMLRRAAQLTAQLCLAYDVPPKFLSVAELRSGHKGITTHANVSKAFHQSTHWDPGWWPRRRFMRMVRANIEAVKR
jgi:N-acetylmuramoyl-L-alanine amidase CwlA